jgi:hypothetical protein
MNEVLKIKYEDKSKKIAFDMIDTLVDSAHLNEAKDFAKKTIDDWRKEGKEGLIVDFEKFILGKGISLEE